jgi:hypothetical protein
MSAGMLPLASVHSIRFFDFKASCFAARTFITYDHLGVDGIKAF